MDNTNTTKENLAKIIGELSQVGENRDELNLWLNLYDILTDVERNTLFTNLEKELGQLKSLK